MSSKKNRTDWDRIVKTFRKHMKMTQTELATAIGTRQSTIVRWESGDAEPKVDGFKRLAEFARRHDYNIEVPWEAGNAAIKLIGIANDFGLVSPRPADPEDPEILLNIGFSAFSVKEAIEIQGDKMQPRLLDGDLVCLSRISERFTQAEAGMLVVKFKSGTLLMKKIGLAAEVDKGWVDSHTGEKLEVEWAGMVRFIVPAGGWQRFKRGLDWMVPAETIRKK